MIRSTTTPVAPSETSSLACTWASHCEHSTSPSHPAADATQPLARGAEALSRVRHGDLNDCPSRGLHGRDMRRKAPVQAESNKKFSKREGEGGGLEA